MTPCLYISEWAKIFIFRKVTLPNRKIGELPLTDGFQHSALDFLFINKENDRTFLASHNGPLSGLQRKTIIFKLDNTLKLNFKNIDIAFFLI